MTHTNYPKSYATTYDRQLTEKPTFLRLREEVERQAKNLHVNPGDIIAHIGEDTGYFSLGMAAIHPQACVVHISDDLEMNSLTEEKQLRYQLSNHRILEMSPNKLEVENESLRAVVSIHLLDAFPNPTYLIKRIEKWLEKGGYFLFTTPPIVSVKSPHKLELLACQLCDLLSSTNLELVFQKQIGICSGELYVLKKL